jgi:hypothetical protein
MDEVGVWRDESSATPDVETYRAIRPGLMTLPEARLVLISTPYKRSGLLFNRWQKSFGKEDERTLVVAGPSTAFNPTLSKKFIDEIVADDPAAARAEIYAEWRDDVAAFLDFDWIERAAVLEDGELPPAPGIVYRCFVDPSGGRRDAMTMSIAHREGARVVVDLVRGRKAPFDPASVVSEFAEVMARYRCSSATADRYAGEWTVSAFAGHGRKIEVAERSKSEIYLETEPLFAQGAISIPRGRVLLNELRNLERRTVRGGRDTIDHPRGEAFHDDYANACCGSAFLAAGSSRRAPIRISDSVLARVRAMTPERRGWATPHELRRMR